jgi:L-fuculose-phosphate aldolase
MSRWEQQKKLVLEVGKRMALRGLVVGTCGNVSLRLQPEDGRKLMAITPSSRPYELMTEDDIQVVDFEAEPVEGDLPPSIETLLHAGIYESRPGMNAVIHTHSTFACILGVARKDIPAILEDQVVYLGGDVKVAEYAPTGSEELTRRTITALEGRSAVMLPNHGAVGIGRDLSEAFEACELLERTAKVYSWALELGRVEPLSPESIEVAQAYYALRHNHVE